MEGCVREVLGEHTILCYIEMDMKTNRSVKKKDKGKTPQQTNKGITCILKPRKDIEDEETENLHNDNSFFLIFF